jgi:hypothetical protein
MGLNVLDPGPLGFGPLTNFEAWFASCVHCAISDPRTPDDYIWNLDGQGDWLIWFKAGIEPEDAVARVFGLHPVH